LGVVHKYHFEGIVASLFPRLLRRPSWGSRESSRQIHRNLRSSPGDGWTEVHHAAPTSERLRSAACENRGPWNRIRFHSPRSPSSRYGPLGSGVLEIHNTPPEGDPWTSRGSRSSSIIMHSLTLSPR
jgi:hypothetical protein